MGQEARFSTKIDRGEIGLAIIDRATGAFVKVNQRFCDIVGLTEEEAEGATFMEIAHPRDLQNNLENMQKLMAGGMKDFSMEKCFTRDDGSEVFCELNLFTLWDIGSEADYYLIVLEDTTERKQAEEKMQLVNDLLGRRVQELTVELEEKTKELEAAEKLMKENILKLQASN